MKHSCQRYLNHLSQVSDGDQSVTVSGPLPINLNQDQAVSENTKISPTLKNDRHQQDFKFDKRR